MEKRTAALVQQKMALVDQLHGAQEDIKIARRQIDQAESQIKAADEREKAHRATEARLSTGISGREKEIVARDKTIAKDADDLKDAHENAIKLTEEVRQAKEDRVKGEAQLRADLDAAHQKELAEVERKAAAEQKELLDKQKAAFVKDSNEHIAALTQEKVKAAKEEEDLNKKIADSAHQLEDEKKKIASLTEAKKAGDEFKRQVMAQRQSLA